MRVKNTSDKHLPLASGVLEPGDSAVMTVAEFSVYADYVEKVVPKEVKKEVKPEVKPVAKPEFKSAIKSDVRFDGTLED